MSTVAGDSVSSVPSPLDAGAIPGTASGGDQVGPSAAVPAGAGHGRGHRRLAGPAPGIDLGFPVCRTRWWGNGARTRWRGPVSGGGGRTAACEPGLNPEGGPGPDGTVQAALPASMSDLRTTSAEAVYVVVAAGALLAALALHALRQSRGPGSSSGWGADCGWRNWPGGHRGGDCGEAPTSPCCCS